VSGRLGRAAALVVVGVGLIAAGCSGGGSSATGSSTTTLSTQVRFTGSADSAFCTLLRQVDTGTVGGSGDAATATPADLQARFDHLLALLTQVADQAPQELKPDIAAVRTGISTVADALGGVGWSWTALEASSHSIDVAAALNDPSYTGAGTRISAYKAQVCHL
jgi:hypothetical protein